MQLGCGRAAGRSAPSYRGRRQGRRSWSSGRRASGRWPGSGSPLCAARLLAGGDDGAVDQGVFEVRLIGQAFEDAREDAALHPATKALEDAVPVAEIARQVAPGRARSRQGTPVRTRHSTASRNSRLSLAVAPGSEALPGSSGAIFSQTASPTMNRDLSRIAPTPPKRRLKHDPSAGGILNVNRP